MHRTVVVLVALLLTFATVPVYAQSGEKDLSGCPDDSSTDSRHCDIDGALENFGAGQILVVALVGVALVGLGWLIYELQINPDPSAAPVADVPVKVDAWVGSEGEDGGLVLRWDW